MCEALPPTLKAPTLMCKLRDAPCLYKGFHDKYHCMACFCIVVVVCTHFYVVCQKEYMPISIFFGLRARRNLWVLDRWGVVALVYH